jgi:serine beta-lactamase-like protein LACTB
LPGFSVAISDPEGGIWARGYGYADVDRRSPVIPTTRFRAASVSKTITVTTLAALWQAGLVDLDAPLAEYRSDFPDPENGITALRLSGHLAGIAHYQMVDKIDRRQHYATMEEALAVFRDSPRAAEPGQSYIYSTHGYTLLSAVIESAAGEPFLEVLSSRTFVPLGMLHSGPDVRSSPAPEMSTLYGLSGRQARRIEQPEDPSYKWAGGGLVSTPSDLVSMAMGYWNGFLKPEIVDRMFTSQTTSDGEETGVGIGWRIGEDFAGRQIVHHAGSMRGARSVLLLYPDERRAISTMTNSSWTSRVERNGELLLEAFLYGEPSLPSEPMTYSYRGEFDGQESSGSLELEGGSGWISAPAAHREWVKEAAVDKMTLRRLHGDLWALVTPYGLTALRLERDGNGWEGEVEMSRSRTWLFEARPIAP